MKRRLKQAAVVVVVLFVGAQFIQPRRVNPNITPSRTIGAVAAHSTELAPILDRACGDCHSNRPAVLPWYAHVAPLSWLMASSIKMGRQKVNFSEWGTYAPDVQDMLLSSSCEAVSSGKMPGSAWTSLHPEARLSRHDIQVICAAARGGSNGK